MEGEKQVAFSITWNVNSSSVSVVMKQQTPAELENGETVIIAEVDPSDWDVGYFFMSCGGIRREDLLDLRSLMHLISLQSDCCNCIPYVSKFPADQDSGS